MLEETLPRSGKPLQLLATDEIVRSVHGVAYTRLWNAELLDVVKEFASDFTPPQKAADDVHTGLYCGEQDLFAFFIDPGGWTEVGGEAFAPVFFVWNSEVGRRSLGCQTFWFQKVCQNHLVWDATEVTEFSRKHTAGVREGLDEIRAMIETLVRYRDDRRDGFGVPAVSDGRLRPMLAPGSFFGGLTERRDACLMRSHGTSRSHSPVPSVTVTLSETSRSRDDQESDGGDDQF